MIMSQMMMEEKRKKERGSNQKGQGVIDKVLSVHHDGYGYNDGGIFLGGEVGREGVHSLQETLQFCKRYLEDEALCLTHKFIQTCRNILVVSNFYFTFTFVTAHAKAYINAV